MILSINAVDFKKITGVLSSYLGSSLINKLLPFLLLPLLTKYLNPSEYGLLSLFQVFISLSDTVIGLRSKSNIARNFFKVGKNELSEIIYNMLVLLCFTLGFGVFLISVIFFVGNINFGLPSRWIFALPIIGFMNTVNGYGLSILRNSRMSLKYGLFEVLRTLTNLIVSVGLVVVYSLGWEGRAIGISVSSCVFGCISLYGLWKNGFITRRFSILKIKGILSISVPLMFHGLGMLIINLSDRFFIGGLVGNEELGIYSVGYQFGMVVLVITNAFILAWTPHFYRSLQNDSFSNKRKIVIRIYIVSFCFILVALGVSIVSHYALPMVTSGEYHIAGRYIVWIAFSYSISGIYSLIQPFGIHVGKTRYQALITLIAALVNIVLNYFLIKEFGAIGAAQATLVSYLIMLTLMWWYSTKLMEMPWFRWN